MYMIYREIDLFKNHDLLPSIFAPYYLLKSGTNSKEIITNSMHSASKTDQLQEVYEEKNASQIAKIY